MNYLIDERLDALSAAFVTGTLRGKARARFQRVIQLSGKARERVSYWEQLLAPMAGQLVPVQPPERVWRMISTRLAMLNEDAANELTEEVNEERNWGWLAGFATAAVVVLGVMLMWPQARPVPVSQMALFADGGQPLWLVEVSDGVMKLQATSAVVASDSADYELWYVPVGGAPVSLGLLPESGIIERPLLADLSQLNIAAVAISREAPGGSVTGLPGEVLYQAELTVL